MRTSGEAVGNEAAMREALKTLLNLAWVVQDENSEDGPKTKVPEQFIIDVAKSALSAPARNCDIYTTSEDADRALTEYCSKMAETGECVKSCPYRYSEGGCAFGWLLAASGTKGEGDGR